MEWSTVLQNGCAFFQNGRPFYRTDYRFSEWSTIVENRPTVSGLNGFCKSPFDGSLDGSCFSTPMLTESSHWRLADYLPCPWAVQVQMTPYWRRAHYFGRPFCTTVRRPTVLHNGRPILQNGRFTTWVLTYIYRLDATRSSSDRERYRA